MYHQRSLYGPRLRTGLAGLGLLSLALTTSAHAQTPAGEIDTTLGGPAVAMDTNKNGVIDRDEAKGPAASNFDTIDLNKSGTLDGAELRHFFLGGPRPETKGASAPAQAEPLAGPAVAMDTNTNDVIEKEEALGPAAANFDTIDLDKSGTLDGSELRFFFRGGPRPGGPADAAPAQGGSQSAGAPQGGPPPATVVLDEVVEETIGQTTPVIGRIVARQSGPIAARVSGAVVDMRVEVGDRVETGDILATIDLERMQLERDRYAAIVTQQTANLTAARADLEKKRNELKRQEGIRNSAAFSQARFEDSTQEVAVQTGVVAETRAQLSQARTQLKRAKRDLADTEVRAPFPGVVSATHTEVGAYLSVGNPVATVINDQDLEIEADVPTIRIEGLASGDNVNVRLNPSLTVQTELRAIIPAENPRTRTRPVRFTTNFAGLGLPLADNQTVTVLVPVGGSRNAVTVSKDAVIERNGQNMVFLANTGRAQPRPITVGEATGSRLVVISGLVPGDKVVVRGNEGLRPGQGLRDIGEQDRPANGRGGG